LETREKEVVARLSIGRNKFFLAHQAPECGKRGPSSAGFTTVRVELFGHDPVAVQQMALAAEAVQHDPVTENRFDMEGPEPIRRMFEGAVIDPFGHMWPIGRILE
jgi:hypothetical protein